MPTNCIFAIDGYLALGTSTPSYGDKLRIKQGGNTQYAIWLENYNTAQAITLGINDGIARIQTDYAAIGDIPLQIQSYTSACMYFKPAGGIGINTNNPVTHNSVGLVINGCTGNRGILEIWDNSGSGGKSVFQQVGGDTYIGQLTKGTGTGNLVFLTGGNGASATVSMTVLCAGNVGIGATSPAAKLHLCGSGDNIFRGESTNTGTVASYYITNVGATAKRYYAGVNVAAADGGYAISDSTCTDAVRFYIKSEGSIGIGTISPTYKLHVNGTFYAAGSSQDYKQSICNYNTDSCMFMKLKPVTYQYKEEYCHLGKELKSGTQIGLIAEEVAETYPELAILVNEEENKVVRNVDYEKLSIILLSEVQKLRREVDDLKHK